MWIKVLVLVQLLIAVNSYKILGLFPHPAKSHVNIFYPLMKGLAEKGHQVTMLSHYKYEVTKNLNQIIIEDSGDDLVNSMDLSYFRGFRAEQYLNGLLLAYVGQRTCHNVLSSPSVQNLLNSDDHYDLVIMEFFNSDCFVPFAEKFNAPLIGLSSCTIMPWTNERFAIPANPSYVGSTNIEYGKYLNFFERVENSVMYVYHHFLFNFLLKYNDERIASMYFKDRKRSIHEIIHNSSLFLINTHHSLNLPKPLVPAVVEVGGIHIGNIEEINAPPPNIEKWINESTHGIIYFSLGSMIKGHTFPEEKRRAFLKAFGRFPQRILWKWENDTMPGKPENVMIQKWMPQLDILCHPNVKAFISHGGLLGTIEAVHCGVPTVVMPQYGDQHTNARALEENGGGVVLKLHEADEEKIYNALKTVLDPNFRKGARELSERFRDRPLPPLETAIYWVEYVARHRGAHHMRTAAVDMPFYKYLLLDVIAFLLLVLAVFSTILFYFTRALFRKLFAKGQKQKAS